MANSIDPDHAAPIGSRVTGISILIGSLGFLKEVKTMDMIL